VEIDLRLSELISSQCISEQLDLLSNAELFFGDPVILGITNNSKEVNDGYLFAALPGTQVNGAQFIAEALSRGAVAILSQSSTRNFTKSSKAKFIFSEKPHQEFALIAAKFYQNNLEYIAAVTGTNGKTSVAEFARQLWSVNGKKSASIGTLGVVADNIVVGPKLTTPDPVALHVSLSELNRKGVTHIALEASSHGLDQNRLDGVLIKAAAFTNLSQDHLDYHSSMDTYLSAKLRLFSELLEENGVAVLNSDGKYFDKLRDICDSRKISIISYGHSFDSDIRVLKIQPTQTGQNVRLLVNDTEMNIFLSLIGEFQLLNALAAFGLVEGVMAHDMKQRIQNLECLHGAPGRLEAIGSHPNGAPIIVDYAHTPDALRNILEALRPHVQGRLICVFGAGGDRDKEKRPLMGMVAEKLSDLTIITDDNPRSENPLTIREEIMLGCPSGINIGERSEAINHGLSSLKKEDLLVIAGKGHETDQVVAGKTIPFNDSKFVQTQLTKLSRVCL
jgi:UDP-N-acetylmuramoyl-L-alanyl-D-glutamate--2,6-diaminopimelate ligase